MKGSPPGNAESPNNAGKGTTHPNAEIRRQMRRELFPSMNNAAGKDASKGYGSLEEHAVKNLSRLADSTLRNPCSRGSSNPSMHETGSAGDSKRYASLTAHESGPDGSHALNRYGAKSCVSGKSSTDSSLQAFGKLKASSLIPSFHGYGGGTTQKTSTSMLMSSDGTKKILDSARHTHKHTMGIKRIFALSDAPGSGLDEIIHEDPEAKMMHEPLHDDVDGVPSSSAFTCSSRAFDLNPTDVFRPRTPAQKEANLGCTSGSNLEDESNPEDVVKPYPSTSKDANLEHTCTSPKISTSEHTCESLKISTSELEEVWKRIVVDRNLCRKIGDPRSDSPNVMDNFSRASRSNGRTFFTPLEVISNATSL
jgi:hypothetical protein